MMADQKHWKIAGLVSVVLLRYNRGGHYEAWKSFR